MICDFQKRETIVNRKSWFLILAFCTLLGAGGWANLADSFENEPAGFGGLEWGSAVPDDMTYVRDIGFDSVFTRKSDTLRVGDATVGAIYYFFVYTEKLYRVEIYGTGRTDYGAIYDFLRELHGNADEGFEEGVRARHVWNGEVTRIELMLDAGEYPPEFVTIYTKAVEVDNTLDAIDSALDFLDNSSNGADPEVDPSGNPTD